MGASSSREVLLNSGKSGEGVGNPKWDFGSISAHHRLVRDKLCQEVQRRIHDEQAVICNRLPSIQESPEGLQQEDVRPILPVQTDQIQGSRHNSWTTKLFRMGNFRRDHKVSGSSS